jgi:hypothetical protein
MDWVERLFGLSPDNGDGSFELLIFLIVVLVLLLAFRQRRRIGRRFRD